MPTLLTALEELANQRYLKKTTKSTRIPRQLSHTTRTEFFKGNQLRNFKKLSGLRDSGAISIIVL